MNPKFNFIIFISFLSFSFITELFALNDTIKLKPNYNIYKDSKIIYKNSDLKLIENNLNFKGYLFIKINNMDTQSVNYFTEMFWINKNSYNDTVIFYDFISIFKMLSSMYLGNNEEKNDLYYFIKYYKYFNESSTFNSFLYSNSSPINTNALKNASTYWLNDSEEDYIVIEAKFIATVLAYKENNKFVNFLVPVSQVEQFSILTYNISENNLRINKTKNIIIVK